MLQSLQSALNIEANVTVIESHWLEPLERGKALVRILSRACGVGSPTNHPYLGQRQDTGPGILWSVHSGLNLTTQKI